MEIWLSKVAVVTGAGSGIGEKIAGDLVRNGLIVFGFEPTEEKVTAMIRKRSTETINLFIPLKCDISNDEDLRKAFSGIIKDYGGVDLLVNNAAIGTDGMISTGDVADLNKFEEIIEVNMYGLVACTKFALQSMMKKDTTCHIININSICGHYMPSLSSPRFNVYIASKRFMTALNNLLEKEVLSENNKHIKVTSISPGIVKTNVFKSAGSSVITEEYFEKNPYLTPEDVSHIVLMALSVSKYINIKEVIVHALNEEL